MISYLKKKEKVWTNNENAWVHPIKWLFFGYSQAGRQVNVYVALPANIHGATRTSIVLSWFKRQEHRRQTCIVRYIFIFRYIYIYIFMIYLYELYPRYANIISLINIVKTVGSQQLSDLYEDMENTFSGELMPSVEGIQVGELLNSWLPGIDYHWFTGFLGGGFRYVLFSPLFGEDSHFD